MFELRKDWTVKYFHTADSYNKYHMGNQNIPMLLVNGAIHPAKALIHFDESSGILECIGGESFDRHNWTKWIFSMYCPGFQLQFMSKGQICAAVEECSKLAQEVYLQAKVKDKKESSKVVQLRK